MVLYMYLSTQETEVLDQKFKASLGYTASSGPAWDPKGPVWKINNNNNNNEN